MYFITLASHSLSHIYTYVYTHIHPYSPSVETGDGGEFEDLTEDMEFDTTQQDESDFDSPFSSG